MITFCLTVLAMILGAWTVGCLLFKAMFKIADLIF